MDRFQRKLQDLLAKHPESVTVLEARTRLLDVLNTADSGPLELWGMIRRTCDVLEAEGFWEKSPENNAFLEQIRAELFAKHSGTPIEPQLTVQNPGVSSHSDENLTAGSARNISIVAPPSLHPSLRPLSAVTWLPTELLDVLNQTYFLHVLATDASKVLPAGKSLLSVMSQPDTVNSDNDASTLESRVEDLVHKAFWEEALESLSSPTPSVQLPRLKRLYEDLHDTLVPLLPQGHPVLITLSSPLSPTSAPLRSAVAHFREILDSLRKRCAPFRDPIINGLIRNVEDPPTAELPRIVVESVRDILKFATAMKEDLSHFVLGSMGEAQLRGVIRKEAKERERELVTQLWGSEKISGLWTEWMGTLDKTSPLGQLPAAEAHTWILRLVQALGLNSAISCNIPIPPSDPAEAHRYPPNQLPPPLFLVSPTLLRVQNYLQALVIAATLRSLVRLPSLISPRLSSYSLIEDFMRRIWTLLNDEIDNEPGDTKLANLADEIIRVRRLVGGIIEDSEEEQLRAAVDRTLQPTDPVFVLLQRRLLLAIAERLSTPKAQPPHQTVPAYLQTGRESHSARQPQLRVGLPGVDAHNPPPMRPEAVLVVKGFEDPVLTAAVTKEVQRLRDCVDWTEEIWHDVVGET